MAVIGSGPSGCYVSQFLIKAWPTVDVTVFEALPTPYGLIRYGIAADHQGAKSVTRQFDRLFTQAGVRFAGNVAVGRDLSFEAIAEAFDIVVLATGLPQDRALGIPEDAGVRVVGAGALLRALNGYPMPLLERDHHGRHTNLGRRIAVIGMGNVAVDVVRLLAKSVDELDGSDISDTLLAQLRPSAPEVIEVLGRSSAAHAKFDLAMLRELLALPNVHVSATGLDESDSGATADLLLAHGAHTAGSTSRDGSTHVRLHFGVVPNQIEARDGQSVVHALDRRERVGVEFAVNTVVTAVGFTRDDSPKSCSPSDGWCGEHVFRTGWLRRGPHGAIAENRKDARAVADEIVAAVASGRIPLGRPGFSALDPEVRRRVVDFDAWQLIDATERSSTPPSRCRRKIDSIEEMLAIAAKARQSVGVRA